MVRNVEVTVAMKQDGSAVYKPQLLWKLKRHVNNLIVIHAVDDEEDTCGTVRQVADEDVAQEVPQVQLVYGVGTSGSCEGVFSENKVQLMHTVYYSRALSRL